MLCEAISFAFATYIFFIKLFSNFSLGSLIKDPQVVHFTVTITLSLITVNSFPPQAWGFFKRTTLAPEEEFDVCCLKFEVTINQFHISDFKFQRFLYPGSKIQDPKFKISTSVPLRFKVRLPLAFYKVDSG